MPHAHALGNGNSWGLLISGVRGFRGVGFVVRELWVEDKTGGHLEVGKGVATAATQPVLSRTTVENYFLLVILCTLYRQFSF